MQVWGDQSTDINGAVAREAISLAKSHPNTKAFVHEPFNSFWDILNSELPKTTPGSKTSWIGDVEKDFAANPGAGHPFRVEAGYSQWRKVYLCHELIKKSGIKYSLIVRARPDATILEPLDLREYEKDLGSRPTSQAVRGHFITQPERSIQVIHDHFAVGTPEVMFLYALQAEPYTKDCCESCKRRTCKRNLAIGC